MEARRGQCPSARFEFTAALSTTGGPGILVLRWTHPDGRPSPEVELRIAEGQRSATAVLSFDVTGSRPLRGTVVVDVLRPDRRSAASPSISYACPSG